MPKKIKRTGVKAEVNKEKVTPNPEPDTVTSHDAGAVTLSVGLDAAEYRLLCDETKRWNEQRREDDPEYQDITESTYLVYAFVDHCLKKETTESVETTDENDEDIDPSLLICGENAEFEMDPEFEDAFINTMRGAA